jgi:hypothetical protein
MAEIASLNVLDASNTDRFPSNMPPSNVDNGMRALEGILARWHKDTNASITAAGTANAITVAANQTLTAYYDGLVIAFNAANANTTATTLNVDSVGAKKLFKNFNAELVANDIKVGQKVIAIYDIDGDSSAGAWQMVSQLGNASVQAGGALTITETTGTGTLAGTTGLLTVQRNDSGATGAGLHLYQNSGTVAVNDTPSFINHIGMDSGGNITIYAQDSSTILDATNGSEDGMRTVSTMVAGTFAARWNVAQGSWMAGATSTDKGVGTINAVGVYANGIPGIFRLGSAVKTDTASISITGGTFSALTGMSVASCTLAAGESAIIEAWVSLGTNTSSTNVGIRVKRDSTVIGAGDAASSRSPVSAVAVLGDNAGGYTVPVCVVDSNPGAGTYTYSLEATCESSVTLYMNREGSDADANTTFRAVSRIEVRKVVA